MRRRGRRAPRACRRRNDFATWWHWTEMPKPNCTRGGRLRHLRRPAPPGPWRQHAWPCLARRCSTCPTTSGMLSWQATTAAHRPGSGHLPCLNDESILCRSARVVRVSPSGWSRTIYSTSIKRYFYVLVFTYQLRRVSIAPGNMERIDTLQYKHASRRWARARDSTSRGASSFCISPFVKFGIGFPQTRSAPDSPRLVSEDAFPVQETMTARRANTDTILLSLPSSKHLLPRPNSVAAQTSK